MQLTFVKTEARTPHHSLSICGYIVSMCQVGANLHTSQVAWASQVARVEVSRARLPILSQELFCLALYVEAEGSCSEERLLFLQSWASPLVFLAEEGLEPRLKVPTLGKAWL